MVAATSSAYNGTSGNNGRCSHICIMLSTGCIGLLRLLLTLCMSLLPPKGVAKAELECHGIFCEFVMRCVFVGHTSSVVFHRFPEKF